MGLELVGEIFNPGSESPPPTRRRGPVAAGENIVAQLTEVELMVAAARERLTSLIEQVADLRRDLQTASAGGPARLPP